MTQSIQMWRLARSKTNFKIAKLQKMDKKQKERKRGRRMKKYSDHIFCACDPTSKGKNKK
jgi:lipopolysaccharide/colanic/teichoic acid biosynthesis glycosyltransferase